MNNTVYIQNDQEKPPVTQKLRRLVRRSVNAALKYEDFQRPCEVSVTFTDNEKRTLYERQGGICPMCVAEGISKRWAIEEMHADHITPWSKGGHTTLDNGQMLCRDHNLAKGSK